MQVYRDRDTEEKRKQCTWLVNATDCYLKSIRANKIRKKKNENSFGNEKRGLAIYLINFKTLKENNVRFI